MRDIQSAVAKRLADVRYPERKFIKTLALHKVAVSRLIPVQPDF